MKYSSLCIINPQNDGKIEYDMLIHIIFVTLVDALHLLHMCIHQKYIFLCIHHAKRELLPFTLLYPYHCCLSHPHHAFSIV